MRMRFIIPLWAALMFVWPACPAGAGVANQVLAVVGDNVITMLDLEKLIGPTVERLKAQTQGQNLESQLSTLRSQALQQMVVEFLTSGEAERLGITVKEDDVNDGIARVLEINKIDQDELVRKLAKDGITLDEYREQIKQQILRARLVYSTVKAKIIISEKEKLELYESRRDEYQTVREIELRRIVLPADRQDLVQEVETRMGSGADFASLAKELSIGPEASDGGLLGHFKLDQLSEDIRAAVKDLKEGQVSKPVETKEGLQLFAVSGVKVKEGKSYEEMEPLLAEELLQKKLDKKYGELIEEVRKRTYIKIIPVRND